MEKEQYYIIRSNGSGVWAGNILKRDGNTVTLTNARRIWYWNGARSLSQLAMEGTKNPNTCNFAMPVDEVMIFNVLEIIKCTDEAENNIKGVSMWIIN